MLEKLRAIKSDLVSFSLKEKLFILMAMLCGFCICAEYAIIRPVSNSVFIQAYTSHSFPYAWIAMIPLNFLLISLYNRFLTQWGVKRMFTTIALSIVGSNLFAAFLLKTLPGLPFLFYLWKDIYIMLMLQQLWSIINTTLDMKRAKYLYGIIYGIGGIGGICGSLLAGFSAVKVGSENLLFFSAPIYGILLIAFHFMLKHSAQEIGTIKTQEQPRFWEGLKLISQSRYLVFILSLVVFMQIASTLLDYQFHHYLERSILDKDLRTEYAGRMMGLVNTLTVILQFVGSFLLVHFLGLRTSHILIPFLLCLNALAFLLFPLFGVITFSFVTIKTFDFSLFGVLRELLYIPLSVKEKFRAKAVIDVFAYRSSKSLASLLILSFQFFASSQILSLLTWVLIVLFSAWCLLVMLFFKRVAINPPIR